MIVVPAGFFSSIVGGLAETIGGEVGRWFGDSDTGAAIGGAAGTIIDMLPFHAVPPALLPASVGPGEQDPAEKLMFVPAGLFGNLLSGLAGSVGGAVGEALGSKSTGTAMGNAASPFLKMLPFQVVAPGLRRRVIALRALPWRSPGPDRAQPSAGDSESRRSGAKDSPFTARRGLAAFRRPRAPDLAPKRARSSCSCSTTEQHLEGHRALAPAIPPLRDAIAEYRSDGGQDPFRGVRAVVAAIAAGPLDPRSRAVMRRPSCLTRTLHRRRPPAIVGPLVKTLAQDPQQRSSTWPPAGRRALSALWCARPPTVRRPSRRPSGGRSRSSRNH